MVKHIRFLQPFIKTDIQPHVGLNLQKAHLPFLPISALLLSHLQ